jgi:hypothetical protein
MTDNDETEFTSRLAALMEVHGIKDPTESLFDSYWSALRDLPLAAYQRATERALRETKFFPKPAELRNFAGYGEAQRKLNAANAWEVVHAALVKYDYIHSVDFGPLTNAVIRNMGGWLWLCDRTINDLTFDRKKFEELHQQLAVTRLSAERAAPLLGKFGGKPVLFQIPGEPERRLALSEIETTLDLVRDLALKKAVG